MKGLMRTFGLSAVITLAIWAAVGFGAGWAGLGSVVVLTLLEVTFSFDNAVVNSKLLGFMSAFWQKLFMTVGIFFAVGVVRFVMPIGIVCLTSGLGFGQVIDMAIHEPTVYGAHLAEAGPMIDAFGGTFLLMIAVAFFLDSEKDTHWFAWLERRLAPLGRFDNLGILAMVAVAIVMAVTGHGSADERFAVLVAAACGIGLHMLLDLFGAIFDTDSRVTLVGAAAAVMFCRLEVLDMSFSFDGVIGAFAITSDVFIIMAGLGAGALWVRSLTVHLLRAGTIARYQYLEHGAHWAIGFLGGVMFLKLYEIELPEAVTGSLGLLFIVLAVVTSKISERRNGPTAVQAQPVAPLSIK